ncbi:MAG: hypothetical protein ACTJHI_10960, partial [Psychrobacter sp.]
LYALCFMLYALCFMLYALCFSLKKYRFHLRSGIFIITIGDLILKNTAIRIIFCVASVCVGTASKKNITDIAWLYLYFLFRADYRLKMDNGTNALALMH